jgi:hypothetical protein
VPDERVEGWFWGSAVRGPRSWSDLLPYLVAGFWLQLLGLIVALQWRQLRAVLGLDPLVYRPHPYVLMVLTDRRLLVTRFEIGRTLLGRGGGVRAIGPTWTASGSDELCCSRSFGQWILEIDGAPDSAAMVPRSSEASADATQRRGADLFTALEQRGWVATKG